MDTQKNDQYLDIQGILLNLAKKWYVFVIALIITIGASFMFTKYVVPEYRVGATILVHVEKQESKSENNFLEGYQMFSPGSDFQNEILVLSSSPLMQKAILYLDLSVTYYANRYFMYYELYNASPFVVLYDNTHPQPVKARFIVEFINETSYKITCEEEKVRIYSFAELKNIDRVQLFTLNKTAKFGEEVSNDYCKFKILLKDNETAKSLVGRKYAFNFNNIESLSYKLVSNLTIEQVGLESSVANLSLKTKNINKGIDIINTLTEEYVKTNLQKKNHLATSTIEYIERQLSSIEDSLSFTEKELQDYRTKHQVMDISVKSGRIYQQLQDLDNQKASLDVKAKYYFYIQDYFTENQDITELLAPSSMGIDDAVLTGLVKDLSKLTTEAQNYEINNQQVNPRYKNLMKQIVNLKTTISSNIEYNIETVDLARKDIDKRMRSLEYEISQLPKTKRELLGIERKFKLNDELYTFMLQKRAEAQIAKASNLPDNEVIEPAHYLGTIFPDPVINLVFAIFLGIFIPGSIIVIKTLMDDTVKDKKDIENITDFPILGEIPHNKRNDNFVISNYPKSGITEAFRNIRTNLEFYTQGNINKVFLITSSVGSEGKSFNALNLACALSLYGKRTVLVDFDLRKPSLHTQFKIDNSLGVSSYLINKANVEDIVQPIESESLDFIPSGEIPPNPVELIASENTTMLFNYLKNNYNYIVIDTPPVGIVTDSLLLMKYSDINLYIIRCGKTQKKIITGVIKEIEKKNIKTPGIVLNDMIIEDKTYGYGYYSDNEENTKIMNKIFNKN